MKNITRNIFYTLFIVALFLRPFDAHALGFICPDGQYAPLTDCTFTCRNTYYDEKYDPTKSPADHKKIPKATVQGYARVSDESITCYRGQGMDNSVVGGLHVLSCTGEAIFPRCLGSGDGDEMTYMQKSPSWTGPAAGTSVVRDKHWEKFFINLGLNVPNQFASQGGGDTKDTYINNLAGNGTSCTPICDASEKRNNDRCHKLWRNYTKNCKNNLPRANKDASTSLWEDCINQGQTMLMDCLQDGFAWDWDRRLNADGTAKANPVTPQQEAQECLRTATEKDKFLGAFMGVTH